MIIFPAIDLYNGNAVRLFKGDYAQMTVYNTNPLEVAADFKAANCKWVHVVDLQGAKSGSSPNFDTVCQIAKKSSLSVEVGGGIRTMDMVERYIGAGVARVILGTAALENRDFLTKAVKNYGSKVAVSVDCRDGLVATHGWTETSQVECKDFCAILENIGVQTVICTDISRDGAMAGTNRALYSELQKEFAIDFIASGGVSSLEDVSALAASNLYGAIIGKAYYTGAIDLKMALEVAK